MNIDRWIALVFLLLFAVYGYTAFFTMDAGLAPFMRRNPVWPSTFPKVIASLGIAASIYILLGLEKSNQEKQPEIDIRRLHEYKLGQAALLLAMMVGYALTLRPAGFLLSTVLFLTLSAIILGERRYVLLVSISLLTSGIVWYLVQGVLGIYLRPLPFNMG